MSQKSHLDDVIAGINDLSIDLFVVLGLLFFDRDDFLHMLKSGDVGLLDGGQSVFDLDCFSSNVDFNDVGRFGIHNCDGSHSQIDNNALFGSFAIADLNDLVADIISGLNFEDGGSTDERGLDLNLDDVDPGRINGDPLRGVLQN